MAFEDKLYIVRDGQSPQDHYGNAVNPTWGNLEGITESVRLPISINADTETLKKRVSGEFKEYHRRFTDRQVPVVRLIYDGNSVLALLYRAASLWDVGL